jgi:glycosyltransferase involved in cell wall biosynthesis
LRIAIVSTHPIQYYAPLFKKLSREPDLELKVFYTWSQSREGSKFEPDFGKFIEWDIPLLEGYAYEFVENHSKDPGLHHFAGIDNPGLIQAILAWRPGAILVIGWNYKSHLASMRYFKKRLPVLFKGDSTLLDEQPGMKKILRRLFLRWVYRHVDYALYAGKENYAYFRAHGLREEQLKFVPHAIDNERFGLSDLRHEEKVNQWRKELGIEESDLVLLFAGKLEPKKDPGFLLRLAGQIPSPQLKLIIVGNGKLQEDLKTRAKDDRRVIFLDFQNQQKMPLVYRLGDIFILPSRGPGESWGLAINEAMACARPVIVSDRVGGAADMIEEGSNGWIFKIGLSGEKKIKYLLEGLIGKKDSLIQAGKLALEKVQQYSYPVAIQKMKEVFSLLKD